MTQVKEGQKAPSFKLSDKDGKLHQPVAAGAQYTVLFFYPKDSTPGCTLEAQEFTASLKEFAGRKARIIGVSGGDDASKAKFCKKFSLTVPLVSDTDFKVAQAYGAFGEKQFMGRKFKGIFRKTFIVNQKGMVVRVFDSVKPEGHAKQVLEALDELSGKAGAKKSAPAAAKKKSAPKRTAAKAKKPRPTTRAASKAGKSAKAAPSRYRPRGR